MSNIPQWLARFAACSALLAGGTAGAATYSVGVNAASGTINRPGPTVNDASSGPVAQSLQVSSYQDEHVGPYGYYSSTGYGWGSSFSSAHAGAAALHLQAESSGAMISTNGGAILGSSGSSAYGSISDAFTVQATQCGNLASCGAGAHGFLSFSIVVNGSLGTGGTYQTSSPDGGTGGWSGNASWDLGGSLNAGAVPGQVQASYVEWQRGESIVENQTGVTYHQVTGSGAGSQSYTLEFIFGQPISFNMLAHVYSGASANYDFYASQNGNGGSSATSASQAAFGHTMGWGGISELRDANGQLIGDFTALSTDGSGLDYRLAAVAAVPEPGTAWSLAAGLSLLAGLARRRRAARA